MSCLNTISPTQLAVLSTSIAIVISKDKSPEEINVLGNLIASIGATMLSIAAQKEALKSIQDKKDQIHDLKKELNGLK
ncbi:hypothetical protein [Clostridium ljungdahlii]|uniref:Uncharacterized protein n=1 Tax=Clostridium ljungdahlii TaxID=1538 RepID=A0A168R3P9_9CLOT|nr:hypothetical protein [Clostridium ljungdahlii]OAA90003.1 hypothetical protein WY13_01592 [Clostridium ljungdahlii]